MTGIFGGTITGSTLQEMGDLLEHREWYGREGFEDGDFGLGVVHHGVDSPGYAAVDADAVTELRREHLDGEANNVGLVGAVTTVEHWLRRHVDGEQGQATGSPRIEA